MEIEQGIDMKEMRLVADVTFQAEDLEDAFRQWRDYFQALLDGNDDEPVRGFLGEIEIKPNRTVG